MRERRNHFETGGRKTEGREKKMAKEIPMTDEQRAAIERIERGDSKILKIPEVLADGSVEVRCYEMPPDGAAQFIGSYRKREWPSDIG
jgi:hypothetical protein